MAERLGRPPVYQSKDEKPATVSLRIPRDVYEQAQKYVKARPGMTLTELLLDGLQLRLETPADPRDLIVSDDNTVIRELQEMVDTAVERALARGSAMAPASVDTPRTILQDLATPTHLVDEGIPFDEDLTPAPEAPAAPVPELSQNGNSVIQDKAPRRPGRPPVLRQPIVDLLRQHPEGLTAVQMKVHLRTDKHIGDTLAGMVRDHVIEKQGSGKTVRYLAVGAQPQARRKAKTKRQTAGV